MQMLVVTVGLMVAAPATIPERIVEAAKKYEGTEYVFGGRLGQRACRREGRKVQCRAGLDCQSLIFFAYADVLKTHWSRYSVMPSINVRRQRLGQPVEGLAGVWAKDLDSTKLRAGDVLFFLLEDYNLEADPPLMVDGGRKLGVWHTGLVHDSSDGHVRVIHAKPGDRVRVEPLNAIAFDGLYVLRWPPRAAPRSSKD